MGGGDGEDLTGRSADDMDDDIPRRSRADATWTTTSLAVRGLNDMDDDIPCNSSATAGEQGGRERPGFPEAKRPQGWRAWPEPGLPNPVEYSVFQSTPLRGSGYSTFPNPVELPAFA